MYENNWQSYADKALNMGISADMQYAAVCV